MVECAVLPGTLGKKKIIIKKSTIFQVKSRGISSSSFNYFLKQEEVLQSAGASGMEILACLKMLC